MWQTFFQSSFKMPCIRDRDMPTAFAISRFECVSVITINYFPDLWDICPACYSHRSARICCIFEGLCTSQKCLTVFRANNLRQFIIEWPGFEQTFKQGLISLIFLTRLQPFLQQWLKTIEMTLSSKLCGPEDSCFYRTKCVK